MSKVDNKSSEKIEKARKSECPRCKGFGSTTADWGKDEKCHLCCGAGVVWLSGLGWTRSVGKRMEDSKLY